MLKKIINRSPDAPGQGGAAPEKQVLGFESLSDNEAFENEVNNNSANAASLAESAKSEGEITDVKQEIVEQVNQASPEGDEKKNETAQSVVTEPKLDDIGNQVNDKGEIIKTKEEIDSEAIVTEFKVPGATEGAVESPEEKAKKEALANLAENSSWQNLAKVRGVEIPEDTFEAFDKGVTEKHEQDKIAAAEAGRKEGRELELSKLPIEAVVMIEGIKEGFSIEELIAPKVNIEKLEALSNAELVAEDCRLKDWPQDIIDKHIAALTEKDQLDVAAQPLRDILKSNKEALAQKQVEQLSALKQSREATEKKARIQESEEIKKTLVSMKTYMDVPITEAVVNHILQKWNKGDYHESFNDTKVIAEFLMQREFGEQGMKALKNREYMRGRDEKAKKLHNIPPVQQAGGKATNQQAVKAEGNFGALPT